MQNEKAYKLNGHKHKQYYLIASVIKLKAGPNTKAQKYNQVNSTAYHLQNIIEDALDMSRIENNKFEANLETFNIRKIIEEVS